LETRRERIIHILMEADEPLEAREIARMLGLEPGEVGIIYEDLGHIAKSIRNLGFDLYMQPPQCRACGYVFTRMKRLRRPSRCPECKSQRIAPPRFFVKRRKD